MAEARLTCGEGAIESFSCSLYASRVGFAALSEALRREVSSRIEAGELTGTELARRVGFTQAHISNFLNRKRGLKLSALDRTLRALDLTIYDLLDPVEAARHAAVPEAPAGEWLDVPLVGAEAAATSPAIVEGQARDRVKYRRALIERIRADAPPARRAWTRFVVVQAGAADAAAMWPHVTAGALLLTDRHWTSLRPYQKEQRNLYVVYRKGTTVVRYLEAAGDRLILRPHHSEAAAELAPAGDPNSRETIVGRVAYISLEP
ncbi:MAG TPA: helix-turn-helix transcriptional regulator [Methylomirabilota bacterium]|nr:helix-turn-helix transcriptional regulator [Methylomirabilota bacterium]